MREFGALEAIVKMAEVVIAIETETAEALEHSAKLIEKEAKAEIGRYQDAAGPFDRWEPLAPRTLQDKTDAGYSPPDNPLLREGDLRDSIGHAVEGHRATVGSDSDVAVYQELGTHAPHPVPPRSFLGGAAVRKEGEVVDLLGEGFVVGLVGGRIAGHLPVRE